MRPTVAIECIASNVYYFICFTKQQKEERLVTSLQETIMKDAVDHPDSSLEEMIRNNDYHTTFVFRYCRL